jgi:hypothetical protein
MRIRTCAGCGAPGTADDAAAEVRYRFVSPGRVTEYRKQADLRDQVDLTFSRAARKLPSKPFYKGYLIHLEREGWVWYLSTLSGDDSIPRRRARDARFYPYR